ncbi:autotransporter outer membrane beta-barrel domain-containing protein [Pseudoalteromonas sp. SMS1]|uniref:autotransporter outer membrane beta-barrel domain-containing protein n=1 Tax=Pseudoalteromonas sp. SMS1 TaxID=2908894 RepID=UPI001F323D05|nr:autotransporter outer membrane beta-barrel domain-containing protein [Pseudoalteromonas sp. SMS1]MCF2858811.1 autotransporter outer membrane beta-barrel domain-containing protein [Pseudoalteromonas sp. SMS1]
MKYTFALVGILGSCNALAAPLPSFSEIRLGFETIDYNESLQDVAGFGQLSQSISVTNPAVRQLSYTGVDDEWGFYIGSAATISTEIDTETWSLRNFGAIQQNDFKVKANELAFTAAYNYHSAIQLTFGMKIFTSSFTRSNFRFVNPGATDFDNALKALPRDEGDPVPRFDLPGQAKDGDDALQNNPASLVPVISVTEDQMGLLATVGARYDSKILQPNETISWYVEGELSTPIYSRIQNTQFETTTLTESFNGWGIMARAGVRYQLVEHIALMVGVDAYYKERDTVTEELNGRRLRVPEIEYTNVSLTAGLQWSY